eukprot:TRINITY_DN4302_c0_g1_i1.p1 TRINITY_DN4302_c0_g1~~TRINITY_DN4302_c0_g1_i1.p1  ORF type:complete len:535 (-),score=136.40 TRINITY_DN4302_c0_g1_i1:44-1618(-)
MSTEEKNKKYDRQIRLWGVDGQKRLEEINICVLNGGALGTETLKNLVLPGIGAFTIMDKAVVTERDLGNNFFVEHESLGKNRAEETARLLHELNSWVESVNAIPEDPVEVINNNISFVTDYNIILATEIPEVEVRKLAVACQQHKIPLFIARCNGFLGTIRLCSPEHCITQTNPEYPSTDLRMFDPFPALKAFADSIDLSSLNSNEHTHVPFPVLLIKTVQQWKSTHNGELPSNREEEGQFKDMLLSMKMIPFEENFDEALNKAYLAYKPYEVPDDVQEILEDDRVKNTLVEDKFWILANALGKFVAEHGTLPIKGSIPDMHSTSESYVALQKIFNEKANQDIQDFTRLVNSNLEELGLSADYYEEEDIKTFCKNAFNLKLIKYRSLEEELTNIHAENLGMSLIDYMTFTEGNGVWYLALRGAERFYAAHQRYPGENGNPEDDFEEYKNITEQFLQEVNQTDAVPDSFLKEIARFGNSQLHSIAAYLGGVAAQEIIKVATKKWIPMNNTYIYNGIASTSNTIEF